MVRLRMLHSRSVGGQFGSYVRFSGIIHKPVRFHRYGRYERCGLSLVVVAVHVPCRDGTVEIVQSKRAASEEVVSSE